MAKRIVIFGGLTAALAGLGCGTIYWQKVGRAPVKPGKAAVAPAPPPPAVAYVDVNELTFRLADTSMEHYIKLNPVLAVRVKAADDLNEREAVVRDRILTVVSAHTSAELSTPLDEAKLKHEIIESLRHDFHDEVVDVYFNGYLVE